MNDRHPVRLRHADAALDGSCIRVRRLARLPADAVGSDAAFDGARGRILGARCVDLLAQKNRVHADLLGKLVEHLFESENSLHLARRAECGARSCICKHVIVFREDVRAWIHHGMAEADAGPGRYASATETFELDRRQRAVAFRSDFRALYAVGTIAD